MSEHALQVAVAHMLQVVLDPDRTWWTAIDHAAKLGVKVNRKTGARYSPQGQSRQQRGVKKGLPDVMIMPMNEPVLGIELKTDKGGLSPAQVETMTAWTAMGHGIHVARSLEEVQEILEANNVPMIRRMNLFGGSSHGRAGRAARTRHPRAQRERKSKNSLPLVLSRQT